MKVVFTKPTKADYEDFQKTLGDGSVLDGRIKIIVTDENGNSGCTFMKEAQREKLGDEYITSHAELEYSSFCEEYHVKVVPLYFEGTEGCREIYRGKETGKIYIRENHFPKEQFAKWYICGKRREINEGNEPGANLIFEFAGKTEKVKYDDWNGVAAYSDTFNVNFNSNA